MKRHLIKLADHLDKKGFRKEADYVDWIISYSSEQGKKVSLSEALDSYIGEYNKVIEKYAQHFGDDWPKDSIPSGFTMWEAGKKGVFKTDAIATKISYNLGRGINEKDLAFLDEAGNMVKNSTKASSYATFAVQEYDAGGAAPPPNPRGNVEITIYFEHVVMPIPHDDAVKRLRSIFHIHIYNI